MDEYLNSEAVDKGVDMKAIKIILEPVAQKRTLVHPADMPVSKSQ